jgi:hypothetical protein
LNRASRREDLQKLRWIRLVQVKNSRRSLRGILRGILATSLPWRSRRRIWFQGSRRRISEGSS